MAEMRKAISGLNQLTDISLDDIIEAGNVRTDYANIDELAESINQTGRILQPIVVLKKGDKYELVAGHRRVRAYRMLRENGGTTFNLIPAIITNIDKIEESQLIENIQRENLSDSDIEAAIISIIERDGISQAELARRLGKPASWISARVTAKKERDKLKSYAGVTNLSTGTAAELSTLPDAEKKKLINKKGEKLTRSDVREIKNAVVKPSQISQKATGEPFKPVKIKLTDITKGIINNIEEELKNQKLNKDDAETVCIDVSNYLRKRK